MRGFETQHEAFNYIQSCIRNEGFDYCFLHYSDFPEVKDVKFHKLRRKYLKDREELELYVQDKINKDYEEES